MRKKHFMNDSDERFNTIVNFLQNSDNCSSDEQSEIQKQIYIWSNSEFCIIDSSVIAAHDELPFNVKFKSACAAYNLLCTKWMSIDPDIKKQIRENFFASLTLDVTNENEVLYEKYSKMLGLIAYFDCLYSWPDAFVDFLPVNNEDVKLLKASTSFYRAFTSIHDERVSYITNNDFYSIKSCLMLYKDRYYSLALSSMESEYCVNEGIKLLSNLVFIYHPLFELIDTDLFLRIITEFLPSKLTMSATLNFLDSLFLRRIQYFSIVRSLPAIFICLINKLNNPDNVDLPIISNPKVMSFVIEFLSIYFDTFAYQDQYNFDSFETLLELEKINSDLNCLNDSFKSLIISTIAVEDDLVNYFYFELWLRILIYIKDADTKATFYVALRNMFPSIIENIFQKLRCCFVTSDNDPCQRNGVYSRHSNIVINCFTVLRQIFSSEVDTLVAESNMSPSKCVALALIAQSETDSDALPFFIGLIQNVNDSYMPDEIRSLMFSISLLASKLADNVEYFNLSLRFIMSYLHNDELRSFVIDCLDNILAKVLIYGYDMLEDMAVILTSSKILIESFNEEDFRNMFMINLKLLKRLTKIDTIYDELFYPLIKYVDSFFSLEVSNTNEFTMIKNKTIFLLYVLSDSVRLMHPEPDLIYEDDPQEFERLFSLLYNWIQDYKLVVLQNSSYIDFIDCIYGLISVLICYGDPLEVHKNIKECLALLIDARSSAIFLFCTNIRKRDSKFEYLLEIVEPVLINSISSQNFSSPVDILKMLKEFDYRPSLQKHIVEFVKNSITDLNTSVVLAAIDCWSTFLTRSPSNYTSLLDVSMQIIALVISVLLDDLHNQIRRELTSFLKHIILTTAEHSPFTPEKMQTLFNLITERHSLCGFEEESLKQTLNELLRKRGYRYTMMFDAKVKELLMRLK